MLRRFDVRVAEIAMKRTDALQGGGVHQGTRKKYRTEAIEQYAGELECAASELEVNVRLAELADKPLKEELVQAIKTGRLQLRGSMLRGLLQMQDLDDLERRLESLLEDQI